MAIFQILTVVDSVFLLIIIYYLVILNKTQSSITNVYKSFFDSIDPIIKLKEYHITQIDTINKQTNDIKDTQIKELLFYTNFVLSHFEDLAKEVNEPRLFNKKTVIINNMPSCISLFSEIDPYISINPSE